MVFKSLETTEQDSGVFLKNGLGNKKNNSVIIIITFRNYPYATLLEQRKTTVSLLQRSHLKHADRFMVLHASKEVSLSCSCVNTMMKQENSVDGKALVFKASEVKSTYIVSFYVFVKLAEREGCFHC